MQERLSMRKVIDVLRLRHEAGLSHRQIAASLQMSRSTVSEYLAKAGAAGIGYPLPAGLTEEELAARLHQPVTVLTPPVAEKALPDYAHVHEELRAHRRFNLTLDLLWREYKEQYPDGYQYTQFCEHYRRWRRMHLDPVMRQTHKGGERLFVDYGDGLYLIDSSTGQRVLTQLWVGTWGASNFTFAEATLSQALPAWVMSHVHAFDYFGCCPAIITPDNLKSAIVKACTYEPDINPTYAELSRHYGFAVVPARPAHPRDKAKVENGVLVAKRWILAALRHHTFHSLDDMNRAIHQLLERLNDRAMRKLRRSRRELFLELDRPNARPLPPAPYVFAEWKRPTVNIDYHIEVDKHYYSVPFRLIHQVLDVRLTATTVEAFLKSERVAAHLRSYVPHKYTTLPEHLPPDHQKHLEWSPSRILDWAVKVGPNTSQLVKRILQDRPHPEQGYRACLGVLRLAKHYPTSRVEAAAWRAVQFNACSFKSFKSILLRGLDRLGPIEVHATRMKGIHGNIRGPRYYN